MRYLFNFEIIDRRKHFDIFACISFPFFVQAVDCGPLHPPENGDKTGEKTTFLSSVTFRCDDGFDLMGSLIRTCKANKEWSGQETFCSGNKTFKPLPKLHLGSLKARVKIEDTTN